jgi:hypothetical protein
MGKITGIVPLTTHIISGSYTFTRAPAIIPKYNTATPGTNYSYIRNSYVRGFCSLLVSACITARLAAYTTAPNLRTNPLY